MALDLRDNPASELLYIAFNQDFTCIVCGTDDGFRVYNTDPLRLTYSRTIPNGGGLGVVAMLYRTNILAFGSDQPSDNFKPHKMAIWDDRKSKIVAELGFPGIVRAIKLRRDLAVVALDSQVCVYDLRSLSQLASVDTALNAKGLCCLSDSAERFVLACPGTQQGSAQVLVYYPHSSPPSEAPVAPIALETSRSVDAHERPLAAMAMNQRGTLLATCSEKGTTVHLYDARSGARLQSLRRGVDQADVHSLVFSPAGNWLAVTADKGTVHVFVVSECSNAPDRPENRKSSLRRLSGMLPAYFSSEWSFAQFRVPDNRFIAGYGTDEATLVVVSANGSYYKARFDPATGGEMEGVCHMNLDDAPVGSPAGIPKSQGNTDPSSFQLGDGAANCGGATPPHPSCQLKGAAAGG